ncbi:hypothetical protein D3C75_865450 [compost metagenome]
MGKLFPGSRSCPCIYRHPDILPHIPFDAGYPVLSKAVPIFCVCVNKSIGRVIIRLPDNGKQCTDRRAYHKEIQWIFLKNLIQINASQRFGQDDRVCCLLALLLDKPAARKPCSMDDALDSPNFLLDLLNGMGKTVEVRNI